MFWLKYKHLFIKTDVYKLTLNKIFLFKVDIIFG